MSNSFIDYKADKLAGKTSFETETNSYFVNDPEDPQGRIQVTQKSYFLVRDGFDPETGAPTTIERIPVTKDELINQIDEAEKRAVNIKEIEKDLAAYKLNN